MRSAGSPPKIGVSFVLLELTQIVVNYDCVPKPGCLKLERPGKERSGSSICPGNSKQSCSKGKTPQGLAERRFSYER